MENPGSGYRVATRQNSWCGVGMIEFRQNS